LPRSEAGGSGGPGRVGRGGSEGSVARFSGGVCEPVRLGGEVVDLGGLLAAYQHGLTEGAWRESPERRTKTVSHVGHGGGRFTSIKLVGVGLLVCLLSLIVS